MTECTHDRPERGQKKGAAMPPRITNYLTHSSGLYIYHGCDASPRCFTDGGRLPCERFRRFGEWIKFSSPKCSGPSPAGDTGRLTCFSSIAYPFAFSASGLYRWRRLISRPSAMTINCPVLSPGAFIHSSASAILCGTRASSFLDFAFTAFVAIKPPAVYRWLTTYKRERVIVVMIWLTPVNNTLSVTFPGNRKYCLPAIAGGRYISPAGVNPPAGRENPFNQYKATQTRPASFFVSCHRATIPSGKARTTSMVALVGQPEGWPVSLYAGILTPASVTAPHERENSGGDSLNQYKEAAAMVATPTPLHPEFTFYFLAVRRSDLTDRPHRETITAPDEMTARRLLAGRFVLCFAGRVPAQEVRHV